MARTFDGVNDQIAFGSETAIDDLMGFTACAYLYLTSDVTTEQSVVSKCKSDYTAMQLFISLSGSGGNNNRIFTSIHTNDSNGPYAQSVADTLTLNTWYAVVTTWVGTTGVTAPKIFVCPVGGIIAEPSYNTSRAGTGAYQSNATATLRLGTRDPLDTWYNGSLAEAAIWNRVLSADEIRALGRGFAPAFFPRGRVFYSPIDGRRSSEINLSTGVAGTVSGATYMVHPPMIYPSANIWRNHGAVAAPSAGAPYTKWTGGVPYMNTSFSPRIW